MEKTEEQDILDASQFSYSGSFEEQIQEIFQNVRLSRQEVENLQPLLDDISHIYNVSWPGSTVLPFGSIVTGLGIKTSDVDCYIELPAWLQPPDSSTVMKAKYILTKRRDIFQQLFAILQAKIPIIKFFHGPTARNCDISFSSAMGVHNSRLIAYLMDLDQRALKLTILLKYWSKVYKLTGTNLLPNYCLSIFVIFFLQAKNILPPISILQENASELYIDGWNVGFNEIKYTNTNSDTLYKLLGDFFKYYCNFKFDEFIISPFLGYPVNKASFAHTESVPPEFYLYKRLVGGGQNRSLRLNTFMCVQDPIEHSRNCSAGVYPKLVHKLLSHFAAASTIFDQSNENSYLQKLLNNPQFDEEPSKKKAKTKELKPPGGRANRNRVTKTFRISVKSKKKYKIMS